ncbi:hypothetical protein FQN52_005998 [Onygenales sp. PD_12]|nr:hypothetical protein FQN52_005998 [Onygenales sp. PD_12]KAK2797715.1 hypothetical protein FQN51_008294 [Onygenales sp. PD_10]
MDTGSTSSSPDPLGYPGDPEYILSSATKPFLRRQSGLSPLKSRTPRRRQSPTKADNRSAQSIRFQDIVLPSTPSGAFRGKRMLSPTKTTTLQSDNTSPWRIRVTVEAEQEDGDENGPGSVRSGKKGRKGRRTTKVPLKGGNESLEPTPKRRRTGKSDVSQRVATPGRRAKTEISSSDAGTGEKKKRGRPRKSLPSVEEDVAVEKVSFADSVRKKMREDDPFFDIAVNSVETDDAAVDNILPDILDPSPDGGPQVSHNRSSPTPNERSGARNPASPVGNYEQLLDQRSYSSSPTNPPTPHIPTGLSPENTINAGHTPGPNFRIYPTPTSSSLLEEGAPENRTQHSAGQKKQLNGAAPHAVPLVDPTEHHREFDSILESEGFSMVSLDTLPSARQRPNSSVQSGPVQGMINSTKNPIKRVMLSASKPKPGDERQTMTAPPNGEDMNASLPQQLQPASQLLGQTNPSPRFRQTPKAPVSSPQQPPPLQPSTSLGRKRLVRLVRVIRAGIALQGVLNQRRRRNSKLQSPFSSPGHARIDEAEAAKQRLDNLFQGLGVETQRELRAGLRFGEELARRLQDSERRRSKQAESENKTPEPQSTPTAKSGNDVLYPNLPSSGGGEMPLSPRNDHVHQERSDRTGAQPASTPNQPHTSPQERISSEMARRQAEWQREREAISRQIQQANSSQVIVIDDTQNSTPERSTTDHVQTVEATDAADAYDHGSPVEQVEEEEPEDYEDIWQQEARDAESQSEPSSSIEISRDELFKPPRRVIPSPWRRKEDVELSQDEEMLPELYWGSRRDSFPILPGGKTQTAKFRDENVEFSSLLGTPESATRRFYQQDNDSPQVLSSERDQTVKQSPPKNTVSSPAHAASSRRQIGPPHSDISRLESHISQDEASVHSPMHSSDHLHDDIEYGHSDTDEESEQSVDDGSVESQVSDVQGSEIPLSKSSKDRGDGIEHQASDLHTHSEQLLDDDDYPDPPSDSSGSPINMSDAGEVNIQPEPHTMTPQMHRNNEISAIESQITAQPQQQEPPPSSWFNRLTDLAPTWLTTPSSRKLDRKPVEQEQQPQSDSQRVSPAQKPIRSPSSKHTSPIQKPVHIPSSKPTSPIQRRVHIPAKATMVDTGTQFSPPPAPKPRVQIKKRPSQRKPLAISGYFTDDHYVALRRLYHKAKQHPSLFPYTPSPSRNKMLGEMMASADGIHSRRVTEIQIAIVDKFRKDLADGSKRRGGTGKVEWSEEEVLRRLFSIIVGEQIRKERRREHELANQDW